MERKVDKLQKNDSEVLDKFLNNCSENSPDSSSHSLLLYNDTSPDQQKKGDYLTRLFEKKKLKEKSLSKKVKTPFDRKLYRTCWPIQLEKVTKIKKKPQEKRRKKPTYKSLRKKKFTSSVLLNINEQLKSPFCTMLLGNIDDLTFSDCLRKCHFLYEPITPQMLIDVLKDPEHLKSGATLDTIIKKLRALKLHLNPAPDLLREEVLRKLKCAMKLRLVVYNKGYFRVAEAFMSSNLSKRKIDAFWSLWYRHIPYKKQRVKKPLPD